MSKTDSAAKYDFRSPSQLAHGVREQLVEWQRAFGKLFSERLSDHLPQAFELAFQRLEPQPARQLLAGLADDAVGLQFQLGEESLPCLFIVSRRLLLLLVGGMLGETADKLPDDRPLTHVERSLAEIIAEELSVAMAQSYVGEQPIRCEAAGLDDCPQRTRLFPRDAMAITASFQSDGGLEAEACQLVMPDAVTECIPQLAGGARLDSEQARRQMESIVQSVPVSMAIKLGSVDLRLSDVANLQVGDVVILDQSAREPLLATIDDRPRMRVWPGKIGSRRACQIAAS